MKTRLSNTSISTYLECGLKYDLHYNKKIRPLKTKSALVFGSAIDSGFNALLEGKSLDEAKNVFLDRWNVFKNDLSIIYSRSDLDSELIRNTLDPFSPWNSLLNKGLLMIDTYFIKVIPRIKNVLTIQKNIEIENKEGDKITGIIDMILQWEDGKTYVADNKTSSVKYAPTSAKDNRQLVTYYYAEKENYKLDGVMYIVFDKKINLNKVKTCKKCGTINESSHKTCNNEIQYEVVNEPRNFYHKRCNGEFEITTKPEAMYEIIINQVDHTDEDRILAEFDSANQGISNQVFDANESSCIGKYGKCDFYSLCHGSSMDGLIKK